MFSVYRWEQNLRIVVARFMQHAKLHKVLLLLGVILKCICEHRQILAISSSYCSSLYCLPIILECLSTALEFFFFLSGMQQRRKKLKSAHEILLVLVEML